MADLSLIEDLEELSIHFLCDYQINTLLGNKFGYMYQIYKTALSAGNFLFGNVSPIAGLILNGSAYVTLYHVPGIILTTQVHIATKERI